MIKLITPPGILFATAVLAIYSAYAFLIGSIEHSWLIIAAGFVGVAASVGTAMLWDWSRYLVYALTLPALTKVVQSIYEGFTSGYFDFQFGSSRAALMPLAPTITMTLLLIASTYVVYKHHSKKKRTADDL